MARAILPLVRSRRPARRRTGVSIARPWLEPLEDRVLLSGAFDAGADRLASADTIVLNAPVENLTLPPAGDAVFRFTLTDAGNLTALVHASGARVALTLLDGQGLPIVRSNGQSADDLDPLIAHGLSAADGETVYYLAVANLDAHAATVDLTTRFTPSASVLYTVPLIGPPSRLVSGDVNGDGRPDLLTVVGGDVGVTVLLANGDGTFRRAAPNEPTIPVEVLTLGDFNGDAKPDMVVANAGADGVALLLGNGDGTFQPAIGLGVTGGSALVSADFDSDGKLDLAILNPGVPDFGGGEVPGSLTVLRGDGAGGFHDARSLELPLSTGAMATGDFNGDGRPDVATANDATGEARVLLGQGDGTFTPSASVSAGSHPFALTAGDFDDDGRLDLAAADYLGDAVTVLLGDGQGALRPAGTWAVGQRPTAVLSGDFNGDGRLDLATADSFANGVSVLLGRVLPAGDGIFEYAQSYPAGSGPSAAAAGDFDGDGRLDLAVANLDSADVQVLPGNGDGTFPHFGLPNRTGRVPRAIVQGDFNGDGRTDVAAANADAGDVAVLLGQGDGTFLRSGAFAVGAGPVALTVGDFNGDGRLDLANAQSQDVAVLLGNGDGTFQNAGAVALAGSPSALVAGDFDEDGVTDLAVALAQATGTPDAINGMVVILLGNDDGTFRVGRSFAAGITPVSLAAGDFSGDGHLDLAAGAYLSGDVTLLMGDGRGDFPTALAFLVEGDADDAFFGFSPMALAPGDYNGDERLDLAIASVAALHGNVTVLLNDGDNRYHFGEPRTLTLQPFALAAADVDGDGILDVAVTGPLSADPSVPQTEVQVLHGTGTGRFGDPLALAAGLNPTAVTAGDINGDGRIDLVTAVGTTGSLAVHLGTGDGAFVSPRLAPRPLRSTPLIADLNGDGAADAVVLTEAGRILLRRGLVDQPGAFAPPAALNPDPPSAARDVALVDVGGIAPWLVALGARPVSAGGAEPVSRVFLYQPAHGGDFTGANTIDLPAGLLPANIAAADLTGSGLGDLVITAAASDEVLVLRQTAPGTFAPPVAYAVGGNPAAVSLVDVDGDLLPDIVAVDRFSGQVSVLRNRGGVFAPEERYRAGIGLYGLTRAGDVDVVQSLEDTGAAAAGAWDGTPGVDLVVANGGTDRLTVLAGDGHGGFLNPQAGQSVHTGSAPGALAAGHFFGDDQPGLAVLGKDTGTVSIYHGDGAGGLVLVSTADAGNDPTGLTVADVTRPGGGGGPDGTPDLIVGNTYGDLLVLAGNGDGSFFPYRRAGQGVTLAVARVADSGAATFFFSNQAQDQLAFAPAELGAREVAGPTVFQDRDSGIQAPGAQSVVTVGDTSYLAVVNSGANRLLIYPLDAAGRPISDRVEGYFTGTDPVSLLAGDDINRDGVPDVVVANAGSNDVSVFLGQQSADGWTLAYRPRQASGGIGPTSVAVALADGGLPQLVVSNGQSDNVTVLANHGDGYFSTLATPALPTGSEPGQLLVGQFDGKAGLDLVTVDTGANGLTLVSDFLTAPAVTTLDSGGTLPSAAVAFTRDGVTNLLVANAGNGALELVQWSAAGAEVAWVRTDAAAPHLADLALLTVGNVVNVYGADAQGEVALLMATFAPPAEPILPPGPGIPDFAPLGLTALPPAHAADGGTPAFAFTAAADGATNPSPPPAASAPAGRASDAVSAEIQANATSSEAAPSAEPDAAILLRNLMPRSEPPEGAPGRDHPEEEADDTPAQQSLSDEPLAPEAPAAAFVDLTAAHVAGVAQESNDSSVSLIALWLALPLIAVAGSEKTTAVQAKKHLTQRCKGAKTINPE